MALITLAQADAHLRLDLDLTQAGSPPAYVDERVPDLQLKIVQAEAVVLNYLEVPADALIDGDPDASPPVLPFWSDRDRSVVQAAALLVLSALYDDEIQRTLGDYLRNDGVIDRLLARLRKPALA